MNVNCVACFLVFLVSCGSIAADDKPWRVFGTVTDSMGRPLAGVGVKAHCGMGTLFETGSDSTDKQGKFDFRFGPGIFGDNKKLVQAATISVAYAGHVEKDLHRQGDLVAAFERPDGEIGWGGKTEEQLFLPGKPIELNFVMVKSVTVKGMVVDADGKRRSGMKISLQGKDTPPSQSGAAFATTGDDGRYVMDNVATGFEYQILVRPPERGSPWPAWASPPITFLPSESDAIQIKYSIEDKGEMDFSCATLELFLHGERINWKAALKNASSKKLELSWDGLSSGNTIKARSAWIEMVNGDR